MVRGERSLGLLPTEGMGKQAAQETASRRCGGGCWQCDEKDTDYIGLGEQTGDKLKSRIGNIENEEEVEAAIMAAAEKEKKMRGTKWRLKGKGKEYLKVPPCHDPLKKLHDRRLMDIFVIDTCDCMSH